MSRNKGFTLLEVIIALAILALLSVAAGKQISQSAQVQSNLIRKAQGMLAIENSLAQLMHPQAPLAPGRQELEVDALPEGWRLVVEAEGTHTPGFIKLTLQVREEGQSAAFAELQTWKRQ